MEKGFIFLQNRPWKEFNPRNWVPMAMAGVGSLVPAKFRQGWAMVAWVNLGETVRGLSRICGWFRSEEWWPETAGHGEQRAAVMCRDGGASVR